MYQDNLNSVFRQCLCMYSVSNQETHSFSRMLQRGGYSDRLIKIERNYLRLSHPFLQLNLAVMIHNFHENLQSMNRKLCGL